MENEYPVPGFPTGPLDGLSNQDTIAFMLLGMKIPRLPEVRPSAVALLLLPVFQVGCNGAATPSTPSSTTLGERPNIVFILTDDLDLRSIEFMPRLKDQIADQGMTFSNYFVTDSVCCPSRSSILRGQYVHNHGVLTNGGPNGGFERFRDQGHENSTVGTWLRATGYRTIYLGKYLNGYPGDNSTHVPPGWDEWHVPAAGSFYDNFKYELNENGTLVSYGRQSEDYLTDVLGRKAGNFIREAVEDGRPFFIHLATAAPHQPATPASRHEDLFAGIQAPRPPSFDEEDLSDKPDWVFRYPRIDPDAAAEIDVLYRTRLQSLQSVDESISQLVETLESEGLLSRTYVIFTSDNGFHLGEHRIPQGKQTAYEEAIHVPLIVRGPGVPAGRVIAEIALNIDFAPTFADLAAAGTPEFMDGRSLVDLLNGRAVSRWRNSALIEHWPHGGGQGIPEYAALRTVDRLYVEYVTGEKELYDLDADPFQLGSLHGTADPADLERLSSRLETLRSCAGPSCREAEE